MSKIIPYGKHDINKEDIRSVIKVLQSDFLTQGPIIEKFEKEFAKYVGAKHAVSVSNGTSALHLSMLAMNISPKDKVITPPITFVATANCIKYCGGEVVFCDINPENHLLDFNKVKKLLENSPKGTYKGIIPVDFTGMPINMEEYRLLADEFDLWIIEDSCHAPGGYFSDSDGNIQKCGNGKYADLAIFSFHPVKHITCGEGGMITTNNSKLFENIKKLRTHGITKNHNDFINPIKISGGGSKYPGWYMEMQELGYNSRLSDINAALGLSQLKRAEKNINLRKKIAQRYIDKLNPNYFKHITTEGHAYHIFVVLCKKRLELYEFLRDFNIHSQVHYFPIHLMPYYKETGLYDDIDLTNSEYYYERCLSIPIYPTLSIKDQDYVISKMNCFYDK